ncbi:MAG: GH92 family glycosyl hydrolase [Bacteroidota bacterium]|nr:GH92 family glycosyl hydrolase [Bacteroidota bacterium]
MITMTHKRLFTKMKTIGVFSCILLSACVSKTPELTSYVDPTIGSGGHGHVFVGASVPFGAVQVGPDNIFKGWDWCSGYHYSDSLIIGFAQTHLNGTGIGDLGDVLIMPYTGAIKVSKGSQENPSSGYGSKFSHDNEKVKPGFYSVKLDNGVDVELTSSERVGYHRYHFPASSDAHIIIDLKNGINDHSTDTYIEQTDATTFKGYRFSKGWAKDQRLFFAIKISKPVTDFKVYNDTTMMQGNSANGEGVKGLISFKNFSGDLDLKIGISPVSADNALANITAEIPGWNFDAIAKMADKKWNDELSKIKIETSDTVNKKIFYTALYHTMIDPTLYNDDNGDYLGTDKQVYHHASFNNYTVFSLWDTYRALNPLYTIIQPERENDIMQSFLAIYQQQKKLPIWHLEGCETNTMPGLSSVQVLAEAYLKGYKGYDTALAFEAIENSMNRDERGLKYDKAFQYIPCDSTRESVASALEYGISSASAALMEKEAGHTDEYNYFNKRYHNYQLYFDSSVGFMRGKLANGNWNPFFIPSKSSRPYINDYSEGNAWQYLWLVPEDVEGLIHLLGGDEQFNTKLDSLFTIQAAPDPNAPPDIAGLIGQYAHGDEPSHATIYLYPYSGRQWKTAEKARYIMKNLYKDNTEEGMSGNDDCGQMSAWYILSSIGFYPVFPANGAYVFGSPLFDKATIKVKDNKTFTVETDNNSADNIYIQNAELNGQPYNKTYIMYDDIMKGGTLKFTMGSTPNKNYGADKMNRPKSIY